MIKRRKVFTPTKKIIEKRRSYINRRKAKIKRFVTKHIFRLRQKYGKIKIINKRFLKRKIRSVRYHYFLFGFFRRKFFRKIKRFPLLSKINFKAFFFKFRKFLFSNFIFYKDSKLSKFRFLNKFSSKVINKKSRFFINKFRIKYKFTRRFYGRFGPKIFENVNTKSFKNSKRNFFLKKKIQKKTIFYKARHRLLLSAKMRSYFQFKNNFKQYKKKIKRYKKRFTKYIYFQKFKRKYFSYSYNYKFWKRLFVLKLVRYYLVLKLRNSFKQKFPQFYKTYFYRRKIFFPYSFFLKNFSKFLFVNKSFGGRFKKKILKIFSPRSFRFFNNKFFLPTYSYKIHSINVVHRKFLNVDFSFFNNYKKAWFFHSHVFKRNRYLNFYKFEKLNYFKRFIFLNKQKFKFIYSRLLSFSKKSRIFKKFKFSFFFKKKTKFKKSGDPVHFSNFFVNSYRPFSQKKINYSSYYSQPNNIFFRSVFTHFFKSFSPFSSRKIKSKFLSRISFKLKKFKFFKLKGFFRHRRGFFFKSKKYKRNKLKKFNFYNKRKFNKKINIIKFKKFKVFLRRKKSYFYNFYRRLSLFFKRRSSTPFSYRARSSIKTSSFTLKHFFFTNFFSRNLFYYNYNKFSRQFYSFKRRHKIYCSAFSARFRKLYRVKNRFKRRRRKFLRRIRFNFFLADFYNKKNFDAYDKEKNFVSLFHSKNNFFIYVHNANGKIIYQSTNGMVGYKGPKKPTAFAAEINARRVARAIKYSKLFPIVLVIRTRLSSFVRSAIRGINYVGVKFSYVKRIILKGHNGLRKPGLRRT